jgi:hypothetical protein
LALLALPGYRGTEADPLEDGLLGHAEYVGQVVDAVTAGLVRKVEAVVRGVGERRFEFAEVGEAGGRVVAYSLAVGGQHPGQHGRVIVGRGGPLPFPV